MAHVIGLVSESRSPAHSPPANFGFQKVVVISNLIVRLGATDFVFKQRYILLFPFTIDTIT